ncbi:MAG: HAD hydrolase family protein [Desulfamplus sp.]|nr:HAD hydrolase family protein [Desulfamplus sp.]
MKDTESLQKSLSKIELLLLDVDGVLTDGKINYTDSGEEIKSFCSKDGFGLRLLMDSGIKVGIITGRAANGALNARCKNLGIDLIFDKIKDKKVALKKIFDDHSFINKRINYSNVAFAGDDLADIPVMRVCGFSFAVANASPEVIKIADYTTKNRGGDGAVREICEMILKAKGLWEAILHNWH